MPFEFLDRGVQPDFARSPLPVLDVREIAALVAQCAQRYAALTTLDGDLVQLVTTRNQRDHRRAVRMRDVVEARMRSPFPAPGALSALAEAAAH